MADCDSCIVCHVLSICHALNVNPIQPFQRSKVYRGRCYSHLIVKLRVYWLNLLCFCSDAGKSIREVFVQRIFLDIFLRKIYSFHRKYLSYVLPVILNLLDLFIFDFLTLFAIFFLDQLHIHDLFSERFLILRKTSSYHLSSDTESLLILRVK